MVSPPVLRIPVLQHSLIILFRTAYRVTTAAINTITPTDNLASLHCTLTTMLRNKLGLLRTAFFSHLIIVIEDRVIIFHRVVVLERDIDNKN